MQNHKSYCSEFQFLSAQGMNKPKSPLSPNTRSQHSMAQVEIEQDYLPPLPKDPTPAIPMKGSYTP